LEFGFVRVTELNKWVSKYIIEIVSGSDIGKNVLKMAFFPTGKQAKIQIIWPIFILPKKASCSFRSFGSHNSPASDVIKSISLRFGLLAYDLITLLCVISPVLSSPKSHLSG